MKIIAKALLISPLALTVNLMMAQTPDVAPLIKPQFALSITLPAAIKPKSELLLETKYTNISNQDLYSAPEFRQREISSINLRDAKGVPVPKLLKEEDPKAIVVRANVAVPLAPGKSIKNYLMLDRIFDLSTPGEYTVDLSLYDGASKDTVKSNTIRFRVPQNTSSSTKGAAGISISISTPESSAPRGWEIPVLISLKNLTTHNLSLATWEGRNPGATYDETGSGVEIFNITQNMKVQPKKDSTRQHSDSYPKGNIVMLPVQPGKEIHQFRALGSIFGLSQAGNYRIQAVLVDPVTSRAVKSNPLNITIVDSSSQLFAAASGKKPPLMVSIRRYPEYTDSQLSILICMTNISDHDIRLDNAITKDILHVEDSTGKPVALMPNGLTLQKQFGSTGNTTSTVKPREALCGVITLDTLFDFSRLDNYSISVDRYDEPDALPGQKLQDLQIVQSNTISITVPSPPGEE